MYSKERQTQERDIMSLVVLGRLLSADCDTHRMHVDLTSGCKACSHPSACLAIG